MESCSVTWHLGCEPVHVRFTYCFPPESWEITYDCLYSFPLENLLVLHEIWALCNLLKISTFSNCQQLFSYFKYKNQVNQSIIAEIIKDTPLPPHHMAVCMTHPIGDSLKHYIVLHLLECVFIVSANDVPSFTSIPDIQCTVGSETTISLTVQDADSTDTLTITQSGDIVGTLNQTAFTWTCTDTNSVTIQ